MRMAHPNAPKRHPHQIAAHRVQISKLYLNGWSQYAIADELKISRDIVRFDLAAIEQEWRKEAIFDFDMRKETEKRKIDNLERIYMDAWERSVAKKQKERTRQSMGRKGQGKTQTITTATTDRIDTFGDPRFLEGVRWCIDRRIKLFALDSEPASALPGGIVVTAQQGGIIRLPAFSPVRTNTVTATRN